MPPENDEKGSDWGEYAALALFMSLGFLPGYAYGDSEGRQDALDFARDTVAECETSYAGAGYTHPDAVDDFASVADCVTSAIEYRETEHEDVRFD